MSDVPLELTNALYDTAILESSLELPQDPNFNVLPFPHPWTGVSPKIISLFAQTGRLVLLTRQTQSSLLPSKSLSLDFFSFEPDEALTLKLQEQCNQAEAIEEEILQFPPLSENDLVDTGDSRTPSNHFIQIQEFYRYASLVLIYRNFPKLLLKRLPGNNDPEASDWGESYPHTLPISESEQSVDRSWVTSLALLVLRNLEGLPITSGTRFLQPMLILSTACRLRFTITGSTDTRSSTDDYPVTKQVDSDQIEIAQARRFVLLRLHELQTWLPMKPIVRIKMIVEETWRRIDTGADTFWWDVMTENGWETIAG